jgi:hypothetical protein
MQSYAGNNFYHIFFKISVNCLFVGTNVDRNLKKSDAIPMFPGNRAFYPILIPNRASQPKLTKPPLFSKNPFRSIVLTPHEIIAGI